MRLFTAIELGDEFHAVSRRLLTELKRRADSVPGAKLAWVDPSRMHVTVRFIGDVADAQVARIREALAPPVPLAPFYLTCRALLVFPGARRPRVIACGLSRGREEASQLEAVVSARLEHVDVARDRRDYRPHVTLARVREAGRLRTDELFDGLRDVEIGSTRVEAITLFESRLSPKGPTYAALMRTPLAA